MGYSRSFVENFWRLLEILELGAEIEVVEGGDEVCEACPHFLNRRCLRSPGSDALVRELDRRVTTKLKLRTGAKLSLTALIKIISSIPEDELREMCAGCEWREHCY
jgi:hypothetical protein